MQKNLKEQIYSIRIDHSSLIISKNIFVIIHSESQYLFLDVQMKLFQPVFYISSQMLCHGFHALLDITNLVLQPIHIFVGQCNCVSLQRGVGSVLAKI